MHEHPRVLVVDDNADLRELLREALVLESFEVEAVGTVETARAAIAACRPSLVILDILLCGENGQPVADLARRSGIAVILMSGDADRLAEAGGGSAPVLAKPFRLADLVRLVRLSVGRADN
jgi:two-component system, OmpR family, response regulator